MTSYQQFCDSVKAAGLEPVKCTPEHWQIRGGINLVNFYPLAKRGATIYVDGTNKGKKGGLKQAIKAAKRAPELVPAEERARRSANSSSQRRRKKKDLFERKTTTCHWCGCPLTLIRKEAEEEGSAVRFATIEHIIPIARGGSDEWSNMTLACEECNLRRGQDMPELASATATDGPKTRPLHWVEGGNAPDALCCVRMELDKDDLMKYCFIEVCPRTEGSLGYFLELSYPPKGSVRLRDKGPSLDEVKQLAESEFYRAAKFMGVDV